MNRMTAAVFALTFCGFVTNADSCFGGAVKVTFVNDSDMTAKLWITELFGPGKGKTYKEIIDVPPGREGFVYVDPSARKYRFKAGVLNTEIDDYVGKALPVTVKNRGYDHTLVFERTGNGTSFKLYIP